MQAWHSACRNLGSLQSLGIPATNCLFQLCTWPQHCSGGCLSEDVSIIVTLFALGSLTTFCSAFLTDLSTKGLPSYRAHIVLSKRSHPMAYRSDSCTSVYLGSIRPYTKIQLLGIVVSLEGFSNTKDSVRRRLHTAIFTISRIQNEQ